MPHTLRHGPLPRKPYPKFTPLGKRKRVTLIAAFRCSEGAVLCADDQETIDGVFRVRVDKLEPLRVGHYQLAIGGSGNVAILVDGFVDTLSLHVAGWGKGLSEVEILKKTKSVLLDFQRNEVKLHRAKRDDKHLEFVMCLRDRSLGKVFLFEIADTIIRPVSKSALIGYYPTLYQHQIDLTYDPKLSAKQVVLVGIHVLSTARTLTTVVGENFKVVVATNNAMKAEAASKIKGLERRLNRANKEFPINTSPSRYKYFKEEISRRISSFRAGTFGTETPSSRAHAAST
jgi:hypothetical protein